MYNREEAKQLLQRKIGKKRIASLLGTTEWQIRKLSDELVDEIYNKAEAANFSKNTDMYINIHPKSRETVLWLSDTQIPFHDPQCIDIALQIAQDIKPTIVILGGDIIDFFELSNFRKDPLRVNDLQGEIDQTIEFLDAVRKNVGDSASIYLIKGNHSARLTKYLSDKASSLASLRALNIIELLELDRLKIQYIKRHVRVGNILYIHGDKVTQHSGYTARGHLESLGMSNVAGHCHRIGLHNKTNWGGNFTAIEAGTLSDVKQLYLEGKMPNWQQGFVVIEHYRDEFWPEIVHIKEGKTIFRGKLYEGAK